MPLARDAHGQLLAVGTMEILSVESRRYALLENGSWSVTSGREMKKILEPLKGWSEVSAPITVKSALREDQLAAIDALADALAADVKG